MDGNVWAVELRKSEREEAREKEIWKREQVVVSTWTIAQIPARFAIVQANTGEQF